MEHGSCIENGKSIVFSKSLHGSCYHHASVTRILRSISEEKYGDGGEEETCSFPPSCTFHAPSLRANTAAVKLLGRTGNAERCEQLTWGLSSFPLPCSFAFEYILML